MFKLQWLELGLLACKTSHLTSELRPFPNCNHGFMNCLACLILCLELHRHTGWIWLAALSFTMNISKLPGFILDLRALNARDN